MQENFLDNQIIKQLLNFIKQVLLCKEYHFNNHNLFLLNRKIKK